MCRGGRLNHEKVLKVVGHWDSLSGWGVKRETLGVEAEEERAVRRGWSKPVRTLLGIWGRDG